ncbi:hypothetical protein [Oryza sativa Japonica Group]|uniref:Uncharacterized protein n=1 Tax=Oryza sativa subsp. japonica TaxID=39947 RepID=Q9ASD7_ORYSJ|nr:hypothetical protein [Oryza sativa Japonica Group]BAB89104.1 hypothetical protein [Oryza sativa Japonica Group]
MATACACTRLPLQNGPLGGNEGGPDVGRWELPMRDWMEGEHLVGSQRRAPSRGGTTTSIIGVHPTTTDD